jgi:hypothetical protein
MSDCLFSGEETDTEEHVIPRWLQRRFNLGNQTVYVPNGTTLKYKYLKVPALEKHNGAFGAIEDRISRGMLDPVEVYLWAFKLHVGFIYRDSHLRTDIRDPNSRMILDMSRFADQMWLFRRLYGIWAVGGTTDPSPIGSVLVIDSIGTQSKFDFFHCLITGTVGINIGEKFILVFLWDQGAAMNSNILEHWNDFHAPRLRSLPQDDDYDINCYMAPHVWACEAAYATYRRRRSFNMMSTDRSLVLIPPATRLPMRPHNEQEYRLVTRNFGLELGSYAGEVGNVYSMREPPPKRAPSP